VCLWPQALQDENTGLIHGDDFAAKQGSRSPSLLASSAEWQALACAADLETPPQVKKPGFPQQFTMSTDETTVLGMPVARTSQNSVSWLDGVGQTRPPRTATSCITCKEYDAGDGHGFQRRNTLMMGNSNALPMLLM
jgi:hypothetical protein